MTDANTLTQLAGVLASSARATMLAALLEGRALAAGELATVSGVASSTASEHLAALSDAGLVTALSAGRHRYYRLSGTDAAEALEAWFRLAPPSPPRSLRASKQARSLAFARTCYDHLAGQLGVAVHTSLLDRGWLAPTPDGYDVAASALTALRPLGVDVDAAVQSRRQLARPCLDWTERRFHLAGSLAGEMCRALVGNGWLRRAPAGRGLQLSELGAQRLRETLGIEVAPAASRAG